MTESGSRRSTFYKYCLVPCCTSTSIKTPRKIFFAVPKRADLRKKWCVAMKRDERKNKKLSTKSPLHCCEDHFSVEDDLENYWQHRLTGNLKRYVLKPHVVPHIFECQKKKLPRPERSLAVKRKHLSLVQKAISDLETTPGPSSHEIDAETHLLPMQCLVKDEPLEVDDSDFSPTIVKIASVDANEKVKPDPSIKIDEIVANTLERSSNDIPGDLSNTSQVSTEEDEDHRFLMVLLQDLKQLSNPIKNELKRKMQSLVSSALIKENCRKKRKI